MCSSAPLYCVARLKSNCSLAALIVDSMWEDMSDDERRQPANLLSAVRLMVDSMWEDMNDGNVGRLESRWPIQKSS